MEEFHGLVVEVGAGVRVVVVVVAGGFGRHAWREAEACVADVGRFVVGLGGVVVVGGNGLDAFLDAEGHAFHVDVGHVNLRQFHLVDEHKEEDGDEDQEDECPPADEVVERCGEPEADAGVGFEGCVAHPCAADVTECEREP